VQVPVGANATDVSANKKRHCPHASLFGGGVCVKPDKTTIKVFSPTNPPVTAAAAVEDTDSVGGPSPVFVWGSWRSPRSLLSLAMAGCVFAAVGLAICVALAGTSATDSVHLSRTLLL